MKGELRAYLETIRSRLRLDPSAEGEIVREFYTHLEDRTQELRQQGLGEEEALRVAAQSFGSPQVIAREMYQAYSRGSWWQAGLAAMPHLLFAILFALHLWDSPIWLLAFSLATLAMAVYGWLQGKPMWAFPWLGYSLLPLLVASLFLLFLPPWTYFAILAYIPLFCLLVAAMTIQAIRRDWLYGSLMLLPLPIVGGWLLAIQFQGGLVDYVRHRIYEMDPWIALSFFTLAVTAATFVRLRQRRLKTGALLTPELLILILVALSTGSMLGFLGLLLLALVALAILLSPALVEHKVGHGRDEEVAEAEFP
jgi:hypothetical protein